MEDMIANLETDIVAGAYEIFNKVPYFFISKKDLIIPKHEQIQLVNNPPSTSKLIQIKKN